MMAGVNIHWTGSRSTVPSRLSLCTLWLWLSHRDWKTEPNLF